MLQPLWLADIWLPRYPPQQESSGKCLGPGKINCQFYSHFTVSFASLTWFWAFFATQRFWCQVAQICYPYVKLNKNMTPDSTCDKYLQQYRPKTGKIYQKFTKSWDFDHKSFFSLDRLWNHLSIRSFEKEPRNPKSMWVICGVGTLGRLSLYRICIVSALQTCDFDSTWTETFLFLIVKRNTGCPDTFPKSWLETCTPGVAGAEGSGRGFSSVGPQQSSGLATCQRYMKGKASITDIKTQGL